jgi:hypothetical protein
MEEVKYIKTPAYFVMDCNKIAEVILGEPLQWELHFVKVRDLVVEPLSLVGKFYNPKDRKAYGGYDARSGGYFNIASIDVADIRAEKDIAVAEEKTKAVGLINKMVEEKAIKDLPTDIKDYCGIKEVIVEEPIVKDIKTV